MPDATDRPLRHIYVAPREAAAGPCPAVVMLHGLGANEYDLLPLARHFPASAQYIAVRAPRPYALGGAAWHELTDFGKLTPEAGSFRQSFDRLADFLRQAKERYPIDPGRLYLLGFSMGGAMSLASVLNRPEEFAGLVGLSGYLPDGIDVELHWGAVAGFPCFIGHGVHDPLVPVERGREIRDRLAGAGAELTYREYPMEHGISDETLRDVIAWLEARLGP
jgi:phospholipase/carboxylesterase